MSQSSAGMGLQIGGMAQQDISAYIGAYLKRKEMEKGIAAARGDVSTAYGESQGYQTPFYQAGLSGMQRMAAGADSGEFIQAPMENKDYGNYQEKPFDFKADPGYQFRLQQGTQAVQSSAAAKGSGLSGATMKALARYGSGLASQEYANAFARNDANRQFGANQFERNRNFGYGQNIDQYTQSRQAKTDRYGQFQNLSTMGQRAGDNLSNLSSQYGSDMGNLSLGLGTTQRNYYQDLQDAAYMQGQHLQEIGAGMQGGDEGGMMSSFGGGK